MIMHKTLLKEVASLVPVWIMQRLAAEAIYRQAFQKDIKKTRRFCAREALWEYILSIFPNAPICYVEFGVYKGDSLIYFSDTNKNKSSFFWGLDTFEGLPQKWGSVEKGAFDLKGELPEIRDPRVKLLKGLFWDT